jgi:hypothetical protein
MLKKSLFSPARAGVGWVRSLAFLSILLMGRASGGSYGGLEQLPAIL